MFEIFTRRDTRLWMQVSVFFRSVGSLSADTVLSAATVSCVVGLLETAPHDAPVRLIWPMNRQSWILLRVRSTNTVPVRTSTFFLCSTLQYGTRTSTVDNVQYRTVATRTTNTGPPTERNKGLIQSSTLLPGSTWQHHCARRRVLRPIRVRYVPNAYSGAVARESARDRGSMGD